MHVILDVIIVGQMERVSIRLQYEPKLLLSPCVTNNILLRDGLVHKPTFENQADDVHVSISFCIVTVSLI